MSNPEAINDLTQASQPIQEATATPEQPDSVRPTEQAAVSTPTAAPARQPYVSREERDRRRREALASLQVGEWREGKVTGVAAFGAFVDLGGVDGLVHVSQLGTGGYVERVEDVVQVGLVVRVRVAEVDTERGRVSLSMREPRPSGPPRERSAGAPSAAPAAGPRPSRPAGAGFTPQVWTEPAPEAGRPERRSRTGDRPTANREERAPRRPERSRRSRDSEDEEWRQVRGDARGYLSLSEEPEEEPAPTTAEELVARFGKRGSNR